MCNTMRIQILLGALFVLMAASCAPSPTVVPSPTPVPSPTAIPLPIITAIATAASTTTPLPTTTPTATITPTPTPENLADAKDLPNWVDDYVHAYGGKTTVNGLALDAGQLVKEIKANPDSYLQVKQVNGMEYLFLVVNGAPLAIRQSNGLKWERLHQRDIADKAHFIIGNILSSPYSGNMNNLDSLSVNEFNLATLESLDSTHTEPTKGNFLFLNKNGTTNTNSDSEKAVTLGLNNNMKVGGVGLVYGYTDFQSGWAKDYKSSTRDELIKAMQNHITTVMSQFKGRVTQWIVANEVLPKKWNPGEYDHYAEIIGDDYADIAFRTARETDPSATLIYNEGKNETMEGDRFQTTLDTLKRLRSQTTTLTDGKKVPLVDAVGLQMHLDGSNPPTKQQLLQAFQAYGETGAKIIISEMDVDMSKVAGSNDERFAKQAQIYKTVLEVCLESKVCSQMNYWGVGDKYNWLVYQQNKLKADGTIFDDDLTPKQAYYAIVQVLYEHLP